MTRWLYCQGLNEDFLMATISIAKHHALSLKKAKGVAEKIASDLQKRFDLDYAWEGNRIDFERPGVSGQLLVARDKITLDVRLGLLLTPLKGTIEREIIAQLDRLVGRG
ncbi:MAG: polyhydroxyalkanoic acid system family protein [Casimicrobiaceae bacterium]